MSFVLFFVGAFLGIVFVLVVGAVSSFVTLSEISGGSVRSGSVMSGSSISGSTASSFVGSFVARAMLDVVEMSFVDDVVVMIGNGTLRFVAPGVAVIEPVHPPI